MPTPEPNPDDAAPDWMDTERAIIALWNGGSRWS
jgi:hypothetical protein